jgi:hypothetical protein
MGRPASPRVGACHQPLTFGAEARNGRGEKGESKCAACRWPSRSAGGQVHWRRRRRTALLPPAVDLPRRQRHGRRRPKSSRRHRPPPPLPTSATCSWIFTCLVRPSRPPRPLSRLVASSPAPDPGAADLRLGQKQGHAAGEGEGAACGRGGAPGRPRARSEALCL